jgi:hypothetical protein
MQVENDYDKEVYNGDIGFVEDVDSDAGDLTVSFDGRAVAYGFGELDMLVPDYAVTDPALRHAATEPALHRHHQRQEARRAGRPEEGRRHRGRQRLWTAAVVKTGGMAGFHIKGPVMGPNPYGCRMLRQWRSTRVLMVRNNAAISRRAAIASTE